MRRICRYQFDAMHFRDVNQLQLPAGGDNQMVALAIHESRGFRDFSFHTPLIDVDFDIALPTLCKPGDIRSE
ncbi:hypothetical protein PUN28_008851 [Cardiocondyla obscurior]|uniref:Uncharacterized protein n=1 Tax=Cardiocondyla obscurior TaxID=286306 RepID=A0AAW2FV08_9HYME